MDNSEYTIVITHLTKKDNNLYCAVVPDLLGCVAYGTSEHEAIDNAKKAINSWINDAISDQLPVPQPGYAKECFFKQEEQKNDLLLKQHDLIVRLDNELEKRDNLIQDLLELGKQIEQLNSSRETPEIVWSNMVCGDQSKNPTTYVN